MPLFGYVYNSGHVGAIGDIVHPVLRYEGGTDPALKVGSPLPCNFLPVKVVQFSNERKQLGSGKGTVENSQMQQTWL